MPSAGPSQDCRVVCLTGFMGSGKSTVGRLLAAQLAWYFADLDEEIERESGLSISQIFSQKGEAVFREIEHQCLARVLASASARNMRLVLALGGGTFAQPRNAALLRDFSLPAKGPAGAAPPRVGMAPSPGRSGGAAVIWLDCSADELLQRCVLMGDRPLFRDEASFRKLYEERRPFYQQADYRVQSGGEPMRVVEQILALGILGPGLRTHAGSGTPGAPLS